MCVGVWVGVLFPLPLPLLLMSRSSSWISRLGPNALACAHLCDCEKVRSKASGKTGIRQQQLPQGEAVANAPADVARNRGQNSNCQYER